MLRRDDWLVAFFAALHKHSTAPFTWGEHDCAMLSADCIEAVTGRDLAEPFRGKYDSEASGKAILKEHKLRSAISIVSKVFKKIPASQAQVGDIAVVKTEDGLALAPVIGSELAVLVVLIYRAAPLDDLNHAVAVAVSAPRYPHSAAEILASDLAALPDAQRRSTGHRRPCTNGGQHLGDQRRTRAPNRR